MFLCVVRGPDKTCFYVLLEVQINGSFGDNDNFNHISIKTFITVKILKFGTPQIIAILVLKIEKFDVTLH